MTNAEACAKAAHEANLIYCRMVGDPPSPEWDDLTKPQQQGAIANVAHTLAGGTQEESHARWMQSRLDEGWVLGPVKDFAAKTHPNLVPYAELPESQRRKDDLYQGVVKAMAEALK